MHIRDMVKPTKWKLLINLLITAVLITLIFAVPSLGYQSTLLQLQSPQLIISIALSALFAFVLYYPLACGFVFIYKWLSKTGENKGPGKMDIAVAFLLIMLFNPISLSLISVGFAQGYQTITVPCIQIINFSSVSPAKEAGMTIGETITVIDSYEIGNMDSFIHALADKRAGDDISITTNTKSYDFQMAGQDETPNAIIGVIVQEKRCMK